MATRRKLSAMCLLAVAFSPYEARADEVTAPAAPAAVMTPQTEAPPIATPPGPAWQRPPATRFVINNLLLARYNPLGLEDQIRMGFQFRIYEKASPALRDNFFFLGIYPKINPAYVKIGPSIEIQPASFFNLRLAGEFMGFFKTFGYLQSFQSPLDSYGDKTLAANKDAMPPQNYGTSGIHLMIEPVLQFRLAVGSHGFFAIKNKFSAEYWNMKLHAGAAAVDGRTDSVWYDATLDTLVPSNGWVIQNDLDLAFITNFKLTVGVRYTAVLPFYSKTDFVTDADAAAYAAQGNQNGHQRLGPVVAYTFYDRGYTSFNRPTLLLITGWYLQHRFRTGADTPEALPYLLVGFSFQSDLMK